MNNTFRNFALWVIIGLLLIALFQLFQSPGNRSASTDIPFSQFLGDVNDGNVKAVTIVDQQISGTYNRGGTFQTFAPRDASYIDSLEAKGVTITAKPPGENFS
ncbi:ATP-dependent metallopeptidase FtsH/Yme1/Tma family protein, partial [Pseudoxanthobacter sp.]|uniref:ATP-dependent metallopeptidase FtsH/Yme1/Tma family protein n=1 Tax=Pseudoxanthobacter sp. TaxID=1925742 RepID=UPI002FDFB26D